MDQSGPISVATSIVDRVCAGDLRAVARAISLVESGGDDAVALASALHARTGRALILGITGAPGAGKSTLVSRLIAAYRHAGHRVAVVAVDPTSPFSGGALLGDRVRMQAHALDPGVFIRSMATRGRMGGLAAATLGATEVLDAAGFDVILIETVGVGQDEVDIARVSDLCVVVVVPGAGDDVQAMKAGVMEIGDIFVVNKADQEGAEQAVAAIEQMQTLDDTEVRRRLPVLRVVATTGEGLPALVAAIAEGRGDVDTRRRRRRDRAEWRLMDTLLHLSAARARRDAGDSTAWQALVSAVEDGRRNPYDVAVELLNRIGAGRLDHVGLTTTDLTSTTTFFADALGFTIGPFEDVPAQGVRVRFVETGDTRIELIEALGAGSPVAASLQKRGPGLHHLAIRVDDLASTLQQLADRGVRLIDHHGRPGAHGSTVAFVHPSSTHGVLIELVEHPVRG